MSFPTSFAIDNVEIGGSAPCAIIAEGGVNHFGEMSKARALIDMAVAAKASFFKTQHYRTERLVSAAAPDWRERLKSKELPNAAIAEMKAYCDERGIPFLCTPHDQEALDFLDRELNVSAFKVGSGEVLNWPYIAEIARRKKPILLSTGMYTLDDIRKVIDVIAENGSPPLALFHCVSLYPADPALVNLGVMAQIREFFPGPVGYSDHTVGTAVPLASVALGAKVLEKHITIDKDVPNAHDWKVSCDPDNFPTFISEVRMIEAAVGGGPKQISEQEQQSVKWARKSAVAKVLLRKGTKVTADDILDQRPGTGIPLSELDRIVGRAVKVDVEAGTLLTPDFFE